MTPMAKPLRALLSAGAAFLAAFAGSTGFAQPLAPVYTFGSAPGDGGGPPGALWRASDGKFYGTTSHGGGAACSYGNETGCGTVFRTALNGNITTLHSFLLAEGIAPLAGLVQGGDGTFYGTTSLGGSATCNGGLGCGTIFSMDAGGSVAPLHVFEGSDGAGPTGPLILASDGNRYGTTPGGGPTNSLCDNFACGVIFKLTPGGTFSVAHVFGGAPDGNRPQAGLVQASDGSLYGTTASGGASDSPLSCGVIYRLALDGAYAVVYRFPNDGSKGCSPAADLYEADGNLYGTTSVGGAHGPGTVFRFTPSSATVDLLFSFSSSSPSGQFPLAGVVRGPDQSFYGTTLSGGINDCLGQGCGTVFRVTPGGLLTTYSLTVVDGCSPLSRLLGAPDGNLYTPVSQCGVVNGFLADGTVLRFTPPASPTTIASVMPLSGPIGTPVTLTGSNFSAVTDLTFAGPVDGAPAPVSAPFTVISDGEIRTSVPRGAGPGPIAVLTDIDAALSSKSFAPAVPTISSLSPNHGRPGTMVTIAGQSFTGTTAVRFDQNGEFAQFAVLTDSTIRAIVPSGATPGKVLVATPAGNAISSQRYLPFGR